MSLKRERYIDIVKGLSILCITFLHYEEGVLPPSVNVFIGSFMVTAFYVTSGWVSVIHPSSLPFKELVRKRWKQLGIPYLWWTGIILCFDLLLLGLDYYDFRYVSREVYKTITLRGIGTLWFLPALFGGELIWHGLKKRPVGLILLALALTLCYQYVYGQIFGGKTETLYRIIDAPFRTLSNVLNAWVGIAFGYGTYRIFSQAIRAASKLRLVILGVTFCIFAFVTANYLPHWLSPFWGLFAPLWGPLGWLLLAKSAQHWKILDFFNYWGVHSLNLMVTHYSIILVLFTLVVENGLHQSFTGWVTILCFILSLPIQYGLVHLLSRYAPFTLGK